MKIIKLYNGRILSPNGLISEGTLIIRNGKIAEVTSSNVEIGDALEINAGGHYISPGFIDMHVHGGGGHDFMDNTVEAFLGIAETHARYGTTAMMPTTLSCGKEDLLSTLDTYEKAINQNVKGADFTGIHIEGPYFALNQKGAQDSRYIRHPDPDEYREIVNYSEHIKRWSAAPELPGAVEFGRFMRQRGILPAIAHTDAVFEEVMPAFEAGFTHATHFYSCMSGVTRRGTYRYAGVVESAYLLDGMTVEIIADGAHLPASLLKLVYKIKGPEHTALITDAMRAAGMPEGESTLGSLKDGLNVVVEDGVAKLPDRSAFAGSVATTDRLVRNMTGLAGVSLTDAVKMMTETPARIMNLFAGKGSLEAGKDADIVIFDKDIHIQATLVKGRVVYTNNQFLPGDF